MRKRISKIGASDVLTKLVDHNYIEAFHLYKRTLKDSAGNVVATFIADPSQDDHIVSEGQAYWMILSARLAHIKESQNNFDALIDGFLQMVALSQHDLSAWEVIIKKNKLILPGKYSTHSASDADLDFIMAFIYAQENIEKGIWKKSKKYNYDELIRQFIPRIQHLFHRIDPDNEKNKTVVLSPSNQWSLDWYFIDYHAPQTCFEIARYCSDSDFWQNAGMSCFQVLYNVIADTKNIPARASITKDISITQIERQGWDGIRGPHRLAAGLPYITLTAKQKKIIKAYLHQWDSLFTERILDAAMYLNLAVRLEDDIVQDLLQELSLSNKQIYPDMNRYYPSTLILWSLVELLYPRT
ncbi:hypothetical protein ACFL56_02645 [Candidatus Margulisiibacteriota bacterium]